MTVREISGGWYVVEGDDVVAGPFETNAEAWRRLDRCLNEPHNAKEYRHDWASMRFFRS